MRGILAAIIDKAHNARSSRRARRRSNIVTSEPVCPRNGERQDVDPGEDDGRAEERSRGQPEQADHHRGAAGEAGRGVRGRTRATAALLQRETGELVGEGAGS